MLRVGLTGGIGCGKSTVAAMMRELGCHVLDADKLAHRMTEPGRPAYAEVVREFGPAILDAAGRVDRKALGAIVFAEPARLARLNAILHPLVVAEEDREFQRLAQEDPHGIAVVEAALLIEAGYYKRLDRLVVVWCVTPRSSCSGSTRPGLRPKHDPGAGRAPHGGSAWSRREAQARR